VIFGSAFKVNETQTNSPANTDRSPNDAPIRLFFWEPNKNVIGTFHVGYF